MGRNQNNDIDAAGIILMDIEEPPRTAENEFDHEFKESIRIMREIENRGQGDCLFIALCESLQNLFTRIHDDDSNSHLPKDDMSMRREIVEFESKTYDKNIFLPVVLT